MKWIATFVLGFFAGVVGAVMFIVWAGRRIIRSREEQVTRTTASGVFDADGNPIPEDDPRYVEAINNALELARQYDNKHSEADKGDDQNV